VVKEVEKQKRAALKKGRDHIMDQIKEAIDSLPTTVDETENEAKKKLIVSLYKDLSNLDTLSIHRLGLAAKANWRTKGEINSKYWYNIRKHETLDNSIKGLRDQIGEIKQSPLEMVEIAEEYHENLQKEPDMTFERAKAIKEILDKIDVKLTEEEQSETAQEADATRLRQTLKKCKGGKCPGADGLTYEFWKWLTKLLDKERAKQGGEDTPDIMKLMEIYLRDIEKWGPIDGKFAEGVMSLLYKKGDTTQVANYRPITLINTDYKLYTRTVAKTLAKVCTKLIHPDQAGFMPNRSIYNPTRLINIMIEACEAEEKDGYIFSLDQEKAYDRIDHKFLWQTLERYGFHRTFIRRIRNIYQSACTKVMVNRTLDKGFRVERGVRQGDPMSCLLYNLAIEPLGNLLRKSGLKGIKLAEEHRRVLAVMYADDTCLILDKEDKYEEVENTLQLFCKASTANFNEKKTEVMAIGKPNFRAEFQRTQKMKDGTVIQQNVKILKEGETMRMLGAWHSNNGAAEPQWNNILEKAEEIAKNWSKTRPTLKGRVLIAKALLASRTLYLATVNGMPLKIEQKFDKMIRNFIWQGKGTLAWQSAKAPIEWGGLSVPCMKAHNKAVEIMWLKRLCALEGQVPLWAEIARCLLQKHNHQGNSPCLQRPTETK